MKRLTLLGLTLLLGVWASPLLGQTRVASIFHDYDLDAAAYVYCEVGAAPEYMNQCTTGQAANDGWLNVASHQEKVVAIVLDQIDTATGIDTTIEVRLKTEGDLRTSAITLVNLLVKTTADTDNQLIRLPDEVEEFRVGIRLNTADDPGPDAIIEDIDVVYNGR